jgi:phosphatidylinositol kinase/protein kinase (PI-3  family)
VISHHGVYACLGAVLGVGDRIAAHHLMLLSEGAMQQVAFRPRFGARTAALAQHDAAPFRLTRTLQHYFGAAGIEGALNAAIACSAQAIVEQRHRFAATIEAFMADAVVEWATERARRGDPGLAADEAHVDVMAEEALDDASVPRGTRDLDVESGVDGEPPSAQLDWPVLQRRAICNADTMLARLRQLAPDMDAAKHDVAHNVSALIRAAAVDENLATMPLTFRPWL